MSKLKDMLICLGLFIGGFLIWGYKIIITSDVPVTISLRQLIQLFIMALIYTTLQHLYIKKFKSNFSFLNIILSIILLLIWSGNLVTAIIYKYHVYDTISDVIGFISTIMVIIEIFIYKLKNKIK